MRVGTKKFLQKFFQTSGEKTFGFEDKISGSSVPPCKELSEMVWQWQ